MKQISAWVHRLVLIFLGILLITAGGAYYFYNNLNPKTVLTNIADNVHAIGQGAKSQKSFAKEATAQLNQRGAEMPLLLQTDERWRAEAYGSGSPANDLATNGCAITSLAMVLSYHQQREVPPTEILNWSKNNYYIAGQGSAWSIFPAFAQRFGLVCEELGTDPAPVQAALNAGNPVVISVKPGEFTETGHIMVLKNDENGQLILFDPNDSPEKNHYQNTYPLQHILDQSLDTWSYRKS